MLYIGIIIIVMRNAPANFHSNMERVRCTAGTQKYFLVNDDDEYRRHTHVVCVSLSIMDVHLKSSHIFLFIDVVSIAL